jgi:hypothetical protein
LESYLKAKEGITQKVHDLNSQGTLRQLGLQPNFEDEIGSSSRQKSTSNHHDPALGDDGPEQEGDEKNRTEKEAQWNQEKGKDLERNQDDQSISPTDAPDQRNPPFSLSLSEGGVEQTHAREKADGDSG